MMLTRLAGFSREFRRLAHGDYQDAKHLADYVALISRVIFLAALSAIILKNAGNQDSGFFYYPLSLGMALLLLHLMKHIYWMTYDYVSSWFGEPGSSGREVAVFLCTIAVTMFIVIGITRLYIDILDNTLNIGAWITTHDQP